MHQETEIDGTGCRPGAGKTALLRSTSGTSRERRTAAKRAAIVLCSMHGASACRPRSRQGKPVVLGCVKGCVGEPAIRGVEADRVVGILNALDSLARSVVRRAEALVDKDGGADGRREKKDGEKWEEGYSLHGSGSSG